DVGNRVVAVSRTGACALAEVTSRTSPAPGLLRVGHTAVATDFPVTSVLLDLGPAGSASALRFDVSSGTLRSTDIANGDAPVPLAANVVNLKFQYGVDSDGDGTLDTWVPAGTSGPWSAPTLLAAPRTTLARITAVRVGLIVRSDARDPQLRSSYDWVLFDCEREDKSTCPGRLAGSITATSAGTYRYRTVETIVPLPNVAWNAHG
ncbi:MAG TPA: PilW family protein, partial [Casimicrobiaceae bacterium]